MKKRAFRLRPRDKEARRTAGVAHPRPRGPLHSSRSQGKGGAAPHGGVFLELQTFAEWYGRRNRASRPRKHWKKKLPSMYHQFKELGGLDITKEAMEVGPTTHYMMGGRPRRQRYADVARSGPIRLRRVRRGHQRSQPARRQLALRTCSSSANSPAEHAAKYAKGQSAAEYGPNDQIEAAARWALETVRTLHQRRPIPDHVRPARHDAGPRGIVRKEDEMVRALDGLEKLKAVRRSARSMGHRVLLSLPPSP